MLRESNTAIIHTYIYVHMYVGKLIYLTKMENETLKWRNRGIIQKQIMLEFILIFTHFFLLEINSSLDLLLIFR